MKQKKSFKFNKKLKTVFLWLDFLIKTNITIRIESSFKENSFFLSAYFFSNKKFIGIKYILGNIYNIHTGNYIIHFPLEYSFLLSKVEWKFIWKFNSLSKKKNHSRIGIIYLIKIFWVDFPFYLTCIWAI